MKRVSSSLLLICVFAFALHGQRAKRVLILDFKNIKKDKNYQYLERSITDAVLTKMQKNFAFSSMPRERWLALAKSNFLIFEDEYHTKTMGLQLGLLARQDLVVGGGYYIEDRSIITEVYLVDVANRKLVKTFKVKGFADSRIFSSIDQIALTVVKEAAGVLPNKDEWQKSGVPIIAEQDIIRLHQVSAITAYSQVSLPRAFSGTLTSKTALTPADVNPTLSMGAEYQRHDMFWERVVLWGSLVVHSSSALYDAQYSTQKVEASHTGFAFSGGGGYRYPWRYGLYALGLLGGGLYSGKIQLNYNNLEAKPKNLVSGQSEVLQDLDVLAPTANLDLRLGYQVTRYISIELGGEARALFFNDGFESMYGFKAALGYRF